MSSDVKPPAKKGDRRPPPDPSRKIDIDAEKELLEPTEPNRSLSRPDIRTTTDRPPPSEVELARDRLSQADGGTKDDSPATNRDASDAQAKAPKSSRKAKSRRAKRKEPSPLPRVIALCIMFIVIAGASYMLLK